MTEKDEDRQYKIGVSKEALAAHIEQFKNFAIGFVGEGELADNISDMIESEDNIDLLEECLDYTKSRLNTKPAIKRKSASKTDKTLKE